MSADIFLPPQSRKLAAASVVTDALTKHAEDSRIRQAGVAILGVGAAGDLSHAGSPTHEIPARAGDDAATGSYPGPVCSRNLPPGDEMTTRHSVVPTCPEAPFLEWRVLPGFAPYQVRSDGAMRREDGPLLKPQPGSFWGTLSPAEDVLLWDMRRLGMPFPLIAAEIETRREKAERGRRGGLKRWARHYREQIRQERAR